MTSNQENQTPDADELSAEIIALRERVAELEAGATLGLNWREIPEDVERLLVEEVPVLTHVKSLDVKGTEAGSTSHILIEGDNLHALHTLQATHKGSVDVIYIDPPYNTGNEFIYNDKLIDKENRWRHSAWLSFMQKRLELARELLAESGVIFISIDDNEVARLRLLCDAVFGEKAIVGTFIWEKKRKASNLDGSIRGITEYIVCFSKGGARPLVHPFDEVEDAKPYPFYNTRNTRGVLCFPVGMDFTKLADGVYPPGEHPDKKTLVTLLDKVTIKNGQNVGPFRLEGEWRYSQSTLDSLVARGEEIQFKGDKFKPYWINRDDSRVKKMKTLLNSETYSVGTNEDATDELDQLVGKTDFQYPKPVSLIEALVLAGTHGRQDAVVLDFFAGSGTTLHAVASANHLDGGSRRCILVTNDEGGICRNVALPRVKAVLSGRWAKCTKDALPGSLRFYTTSFMKRRRNPDRMRMEVAAHTVDLVSVREMVADAVKVSDELAMLFGDGRSIAVVPTFDADHEAVCALADKQVRDGDERRAYLFTWNRQGIEPEIAALWPGWEVQPLPAEMLAELRNLAPARNLFDDAEVIS